jgi:hypothetical protein
MRPRATPRKPKPVEASDHGGGQRKTKKQAARERAEQVGRTKAGPVAAALLGPANGKE